MATPTDRIGPHPIERELGRGGMGDPQLTSRDMLPDGRLLCVRKGRGERNTGRIDITPHFDELVRHRMRELPTQ